MNAAQPLSTTPGNIAPFRADSHLLGLIQRVASGQQRTRIVLDGQGEITIDPVKRRFIPTVANMEWFCRQTPAQYRLEPAPAPAGMAASGERDIKELFWTAAYHASVGRLPAGCTKYDVIRLRHWPNLSRLPCSPNLMRLCALLARRPSSINLARKLLRMDEFEAYSFYCAALAADVIEVINRAPAGSEEDGAGAPATAGAAAEPVPESEAVSGGKSILRLLWNKIAGS